MNSSQSIYLKDDSQGDIDKLIDMAAEGNRREQR